MTFTEIPTPLTDAAFDALARGACGTVYIRTRMEQLEKHCAELAEALKSAAHPLETNCEYCEVIRMQALARYDNFRKGVGG